MKYLQTLILLFLSLAISYAGEKDYTKYVDPFIGTGGHGHTYPGASVPFGMVQLSPDTRQYNWDACAGYHYSDSTIMGFSHTHLSGTGIADYADILLMPTTGNVQLSVGDEKDPESGYRSRFRHSTEKASPGYYSVKLDDHNINVELTAAKRAGFHKYTFPETDIANIIVDLTHHVREENVKELYIKVVNDHEIEGLRRTQGWAEDHYVYFVAQFSVPFTKYAIAVDEKVSDGLKEATGKNIKAYVQYQNGTKQVLVKVGISAVSTEGARKNLNTAIPDWNFDKVVSSAKTEWNKELSKIDIEAADDQKTIFYTSVYHAYLNPNTFMDVDGKYRGIDHQIHNASGFENHTVFSLWDTFRATHPLFTITQQEKTTDLIKTMLSMYDQRGILPIWELAGNETGTMIGNHAIPVIVDAYLKGINNFDVEKAYKAITASADQDVLGLDYWKQIGYIPADKENESVSKALEYAYDDWCVAQMAKMLNKDKDFQYYMKRSQYYKNFYDASVGFMRGKNSDGTWKTPFDPKFSRHREDEYTEGNAWQWLWFVPQDIPGLINILGGPEKFEAKLDTLFTTDSRIAGENASMDISGLIGQYAHGNEPSQHIAYLYNYAGKPWKTQERIREILTTMYHSGPEGLCGNEDCGQMSSWYILSSIGFYSVTPGEDFYAIGSPLFKCVTINLPDGKKFIIKAENVSVQNKYIQTASLNGKTLESFKLYHKDIMNGGELVFKMGSMPGKDWGIEISTNTLKEKSSSN